MRTFKPQFQRPPDKNWLLVAECKNIIIMYLWPTAVSMLSAAGWTLNLYVLDETLKHDASCLCECVALTLERVAQIAQKRGVAFPHTILLMSDNCVRECKNQFFMLYMTNILAKYKCRVIGLLNLRKAHSHSGIDQLWGLIARRISCCDTLYSPTSVITTILQELHRPSLRSWIGLNSEIHCEKLDAVRAWKGHFQTPQQVGFAGGLLEDDTANHCFLMMLRRGMEPKRVQTIDTLGFFNKPLF